jgi:serine/threonine-protein kinase
MKLLFRGALLVALAPHVAHAEPTKDEAQASAEPSLGDERRTTAEALFLEGRRLVAAGRAEEACPKFAQSQALDPGIGTLLNLARCYAFIGRTASAWAAYRDAAGQARGAGQSERERIARAEADRLEPALPRVELTFAEPARRQALSLTMDGERWPAALIGVKAPIDPGRHTLVVSGAGLVALTTHFETAPGQTTPVVVPALRAEPPPPAPERREAEPWRGTHTTAVVLAAAGVAALATGGFFGLEARATYQRGDSRCNDLGQCDERGLALREEAFDRARLSTVAFSAGAAALIGAAVVWFTRRPPDQLPWQSGATRKKTPLVLQATF